MVNGTTSVFTVAQHAPICFVYFAHNVAMVCATYCAVACGANVTVTQKYAFSRVRVCNGLVRMCHPLLAYRSGCCGMG